MKNTNTPDTSAPAAAQEPDAGSVCTQDPKVQLEELQKQNAELGMQLDEARKLIATLTETNSGLNSLLNRYANGLLKLIDIASAEK